MGEIIEFPDDKRAGEKIQELKKTLENLVLKEIILNLLFVKILKLNIC